MSGSVTSRRIHRQRAMVVFSVLGLLLALTGCDEFGARRKIQKADKLYTDGHYAEAVPLYEEALKVAPQLAIGHHNAGLAYSKLFVPGDESPENLHFADKATEHFQEYLKSNPGDGPIVGIMTRIWMDAGQYKKALAYWEGELAKDPNNPEVIEIVASINRQAGDWETAIEWHYRQAEAVHDIGAKVDVYLLIAKIVWHKLSDRDKILAYDRLRIADIGIAAMTKAMDLKPPDDKAMELHGYMASIFEFRALAHGASWARDADRASTQYHRNQWRILNEEYQKQKKAEEQKDAEKNGADKAPDGQTGRLDPSPRATMVGRG